GQLLNSLASLNYVRPSESLLLSREGVSIFARTVRMHLKPNSVAQYTETMERDVIPLLRRQQGFKDEITLLPADGSGDAVAISFWEKRENADAYQRDAYPDVLTAVAKVADGTPNVQTSEVSNSTWHKIAAR